MNCEEALMMKMAELDGEQARSIETDAHIEGCEDCSREIAAMRSLDVLFEAHEPMQSDVSVWPHVSDRISKQTPSVGWGIFAIPVLALVAFKVFGMTLPTEPGLLFGLVPVAIAAGLFILLRENPFKVNSELILEK